MKLQELPALITVCSTITRSALVVKPHPLNFPLTAPPPYSARGLDIPAIKTVVNFDVSKDIDTHVHRIGRTGRAGEKGTAFTLVVPKNVQFAGDLVRNLASWRWGGGAKT